MFYLKHCGRYVRYIDRNIELTKNQGEAMQFPTSDEADYYVKDNGRKYNEFDIVMGA